jgi:hypothetical protein
LNPEEKEFNISTSKRNSWGKIQSELDKCVLVCLNCHSGIHSGLLNIEDYLHKQISKEESETNLKKVYPVWRSDAYKCLECGKKLTQITQKYCSEHK